MFSLRSLIVLVALVILGQSALANGGRRHNSRRNAELRNEIPMPSLSAQVLQTTRVMVSLQDALRLSTAQLHAFDACTVASLRELALAATPADITQAQHHYLVGISRVLSASQLSHYLALHPQFSEALLHVEGPEVAAR